MTRFFVGRGLVVAGAFVALVGIAAPAWAQNGSLQGKVSTEKGLPADAASVTLEQVGGTRKTDTLTDKNGVWIKTGLAAGAWTVSVAKNKLSGKAENVAVVAGKTTDAPEIIIDEKGGRAIAKNAAVVSPEEAARKNRENAELEKLLTEANAAVAGGRSEEAIEKLTALTNKLEKCSRCFLNMGDVYVKMNKLEEAEKAFLKASEFDATSADPYKALANIYNTQGKLNDAAKASAKAAELMAASGGLDAISTYNLGVILWNQYSTEGGSTKAAEAAAAFDKAIALDPKYAEAYYLAGLAYVTQGKNVEAKARLTEYLKLAPTGPNAATAKALLDSIK
jgi:tetratricopeptide (TPR) repeat protein